MAEKDHGDVPDVDLPSTLERSDDKAQRTYAKAKGSAEESYGDGERANRVAWSALKHTHEKVGDHWEPKEELGPSDAQAEGGCGRTGTPRAASTRTRARSTCWTWRAVSTSTAGPP